MKINEIPIDKKTKIILLEVLNQGYANEIEAVFLTQKFHLIKVERCCRCPYDFSYNMVELNNRKDLKDKKNGYTGHAVNIDKETKIILLKVLKQGFATNEQRKYIQDKFDICIIPLTDICDCGCPYDNGYTINDYENKLIPDFLFE